MSKKTVSTSLIVTFLVIAVVMVGLKLVGDMSDHKKGLKSCHQLWTTAGFTLDEAKSECRR